MALARPPGGECTLRCLVGRRRHRRRGARRRRGAGRGGTIDAFGAGVDEGCGSAYSAKIAGRFATSFSGVAVPANTTRCGGSVGEASGAAIAPGLPEAPGTGLPSAPDAPGLAVVMTVTGGEPEVPGFGEPPGVATEAGARVGSGGGVEVASSSATASRYFASFSPEFQSASPNSPSRYCEATSRGMSSAIRG